MIGCEPLVCSNKNWKNPSNRWRESWIQKDEKQSDVTEGKNETFLMCPCAIKLRSPENVIKFSAYIDTWDEAKQELYSHH